MLVSVYDYAGPWARATLPDGQQLDVLVISRRRTRDGAWWYEAEVLLPAREELPDDTTRLTLATTSISVPATHVTPIPGEDYSSLLTEGAVEGRQWVLARLRMQAVDGPAWRLHRRGCWQITGDIHRLTTYDAVQALRDPQHCEPCHVCTPQAALPM